MALETLLVAAVVVIRSALLGAVAGFWCDATAFQFLFNLVCSKHANTTIAFENPKRIQVILWLNCEIKQ